MFEISQLKAKTLVQLQEIAKTIGLKRISQLKKADLISRLLEEQETALKETDKKNGSS